MCVISSVLASSLALLLLRLFSEMASLPPEQEEAEEEAEGLFEEEEEDLQLPQAEDDDVFGEKEEEEEKKETTGTEDALQAAADVVMAASMMMCLICGLHCRKKAQIFCAFGCEGLVRAASRDAKAQGPEQFKAWQALRKMGGKAFRDSLLAFQARCGIAHRGYRRPVFAWARQLMVVSMSTVVQKGKKMRLAIKDPIHLMGEGERRDERRTGKWGVVSTNRSGLEIWQSIRGYEEAAHADRRFCHIVFADRKARRVTNGSEIYNKTRMTVTWQKRWVPWDQTMTSSPTASLPTLWDCHPV